MLGSHIKYIYIIDCKHKSYNILRLPTLSPPTRTNAYVPTTYVQPSTQIKMHGAGPARRPTLPSKSPTAHSIYQDNTNTPPQEFLRRKNGNDQSRDRFANKITGSAT